MPKRKKPRHPGRILLEDYMEPRGLSQNKLSQMIRTEPGRINLLVRERRGITADSAIRLAKVFGTTPEYWMDLQRDYDIAITREKIWRTVRFIRPLADDMED